MRVDLLHIVVVLFLCIASIAQAQTLTSYLQNKNISNEACTRYHGLLDGAYELEMMLCGDKGAYKMLSSNDIYMLEVEGVNDQIELYEWDERNQHSGVITLTKSDIGYEGRWMHTESQSGYDFKIFENHKNVNTTSPCLTSFSGLLGDELVDIIIHHVTSEIEIIKRYGNRKRYITSFDCQNSGEHCIKKKAIVEGFDGLTHIEILEGKNNRHKLIPYNGKVRGTATELTLGYKVQNEVKTYADYQSLLFAEYPMFGIQSIDKYLLQMQIEWIKNTSQDLRELYAKEDAIIVDDRLQFQSFSWIDVEVWTSEYISGVQYQQCSWEKEVLARAFHYSLEKKEALPLTYLWKEGFTPDQYAYQQGMENNDADTWLMGHDAMYRVYFDRINGVQRDEYPYADLRSYIDRGSWLDRLLDENKIKR